MFVSVKSNGRLEEEIFAYLLSSFIQLLVVQQSNDRQRDRGDRERIVSGVRITPSGFDVEVKFIYEEHQRR